jgi:hypothetical protein
MLKPGGDKMKHYDYKKNSQLIEEWRRKKKKNEIKLAANLQEEFGKYPLINIIQAISKAAIVDLLTFADRGELQEYVEGLSPKAYRFWTDRRMQKRIKKSSSFKSTNKFGFFELIAKTPITITEDSTVPLDPADCSDIMRMYGEFVENVGESKKGFTKSFYSFAEKFGKGGRKWTHYDWLIDRRRIRYEKKIKHMDMIDWDTMKSTTPEEEAKKIKGKRDDRLARWERPEPMAKDFFKGKKGRLDEKGHVRVKGKRMEEVLEADDVRIREEVREWSEAKKNPKELWKKILAKMSEEILVYSVGDPMPGTYGWKLRPESAIYQIDKAFGLPEGADISGTTADALFVIEALYETLVDAPIFKKQPALLNDLLEIRPLIGLLPMATMTSRAHHTTLECGMTLTINDYINYAIGYYTTLFPEAWINMSAKKKTDMTNLIDGGNIVKNSRFKTRLKEVWKILQKHENHEDNRRLVLYYLGPRVPASGLLLMDTEAEIARFKKVCSIRDNLMTWMPAVYSTKLQQRYIDKLIIGHTFLFHGIAPIKMRKGTDGPWNMTLTPTGKEEYRRVNWDSRISRIYDFWHYLGPPQRKAGKQLWDDALDGIFSE